MLHAALDDGRTKLADYHTKMRSKSVADALDTLATQSLCMVGIEDIQDPSRVTTNGGPKSKRLKADMDKSIKNLCGGKRGI
ncbi:hypothetical protein AHAS_Ahas09G0158100 [Arachis hypogaea]